MLRANALVLNSHHRDRLQLPGRRPEESGKQGMVLILKRRADAAADHVAAVEPFQPHMNLIRGHNGEIGGDLSSNLAAITRSAVVGGRSPGSERRVRVFAAHNRGSGQPTGGGFEIVPIQNGQAKIEHS